jgi:hypothetical protein
LIFLAAGILCIPAAALFPASRRKARIRFLASLSVGIGFCLDSVAAKLAATEPQWHRLVLGGIGISVIYGGILKFRRDPLAKRPSRSI